MTTFDTLTEPLALGPRQVLAHCAFCNAQTPQGTPHTCAALRTFREAETERRATEADERAHLLELQRSAAENQAALARSAEPPGWYTERRRQILDEWDANRRKQQYCPRCERKIVPASEHVVGDPGTVPLTHGLGHQCVARLDPAVEVMLAEARAQSSVPLEIAELRRRLADLEGGSQ